MVQLWHSGASVVALAAQPTVTHVFHHTVGTMTHTGVVTSAAVGFLPSDVNCARTLPSRPAVQRPLPDWLAETTLRASESAGYHNLWGHQFEALAALHRRNSVVLSTGTGSGKSLVYQIEAMRLTHEDPRARTIYLAPTKALGHDQARAFEWTGLRVGVLDGDTPHEERRWMATHAQVVITNPDMLSASLLPRHRQWRGLLRNMRLLVVDESHVYRGVFGSHTALILRRLLRLARLMGAEPVVVAASATVVDPASTTALLTGEQLTPVSSDGSPRGRIEMLLLPPETAPGSSLFSQSAQVLGNLVAQGRRSLLFVQSRIGAERLAEMVREHLPLDIAERVVAYRAGLLPEERREIESQLRNGQLLAVTSTNALELGMDISGLDAVVIAGWPGRRAAFWQQVGRAGRAGADGVAVLVAQENPLDRYLVTHPEEVFDAPAEAGVIDPNNPSVLRAHLVAAAAEAPLREVDVAPFGPRAPTIIADLVTEGVLRERPTGVFWPEPEPPAAIANIRGIDAPDVQIVEMTTGRLLGSVGAAGAATTVYPGAVYLHLGAYYDVVEWDIDSAVAFVRPSSGQFVTSALSESWTDIEAIAESRSLGAGQLFRGSVTVTSRVTGYHRRRRDTGQILSTHPLDLPERALHTEACWWTLADNVLAEAGVSDTAGAAHAAEHAAIGLLPLFATCDRWDVGGMSTVHHPATGCCTIFIYDGHQGGIGFAAAGYAAAEQWLTATRETVSQCACLEGCPACVQSPKCGNGNEPLAKAEAAVLLELLVGD